MNNLDRLDDWAGRHKKHFRLVLALALLFVVTLAAFYSSKRKLQDQQEFIEVVPRGDIVAVTVLGVPDQFAEVTSCTVRLERTSPSFGVGDILPPSEMVNITITYANDDGTSDRREYPENEGAVGPFVNVRSATITVARRDGQVIIRDQDCSLQ